MWTTSCVINTIDTAVCVACLSPFLIGITGSKKDEEKRRRRKRRKRRGGGGGRGIFGIKNQLQVYHKYCTFSVT